MTRLFRPPKDRFTRSLTRERQQSRTGAKLQQNEKVRTAKDGRAVVRLGDGSLIEMKDRSELYLTRAGKNTTIHLNRGSIVVEAAKQKDGQLFVESADSLVSVTGTVFSVNNGTKGSRISVIEGEVNLNHAGSDRVLRPGEQATTNPAITTIPVKDEVAWSRNAGSVCSSVEWPRQRQERVEERSAARGSQFHAPARPDAGEHCGLRRTPELREHDC